MTFHGLAEVSLWSCGITSERWTGAPERCERTKTHRIAKCVDVRCVCLPCVYVLA